MKATSLFLTLLASMTFLVSSSHAAPQEHLATIPEATPAEREVLSLLQIGRPYIQPSGEITVPLYNPTKHILKGCVVRVSFPSQKIERIYYSAAGNISPLTDGVFRVSTSLNNKRDEDMKCEILKVLFEEKKKS